MKKSIYIAVLAAMALAFPAWSQTITVTSPTAGATWCVGVPCTVTWTTSGAVPASVSIRLRREGAAGSEAAWVLTNNTASAAGTFSATVPADLAAGRYFVRVKATDVAQGDSPVFSVAACAAPSIVVTAPAAGASWPAGSEQTIAWTRSGTLPHLVQITLRREGASEGEDPALRIADGCANNGSRRWPIPASLPPGRYFVRVRASSVAQGDSAVFTVTGPTTVPAPASPAVAPHSRPPIRFRVNKPRGGDVVGIGSRVPIAWQAPSADSGENAGYTFTVKAVRQSDGREFEIVANRYVNPGEGVSHSWNVDRRIYEGYPGDYRIRVVGYTGLTAESGVFRLNAPGDEASPPETITVFRPRSEEELAVGATATVEWRTPEAIDGNGYGDRIKITAERVSDRRKVVIAESCPNQPGLNYYRWFIDPAQFRAHTGEYRLQFECRSAHRSEGGGDYYTLRDLSNSFYIRSGPLNPYSEEKLEDLAIEVVAGSMNVSEVFGDNPGTNRDKYRVRCSLRVVNKARDVAGRPRPEIDHARCQWILEADNSRMAPFPDTSLHYFELGPIGAEASVHPVDISFLVRDDRVDENSRIRIRFVIDPYGQLEAYSPETIRDNTAWTPWFHPRN